MGSCPNVWDRRRPRESSKKYMTRLADPARSLAFTTDFKRQASIGQAWVKTQTESKPNMGPTSSQQTEKKVTLCSSTKTKEAYSCSTW